MIKSQINNRFFNKWDFSADNRLRNFHTHIMYKFLEILFFCSLCATVVVLVLGLSTMFSKSSNRLTYSNRLMRLRVMLQGLSIMLFLLLLLLK